MVRLAELKKEFEEQAGVPALKRFAEIVCSPGSLEGRRMTSIADWKHAIAKLIKRVAAIPSKEDSIPSPAELICTQPEHIAVAIAEAEVDAGNFTTLIKEIHPDTSGLPEEIANRGSMILTQVKQNPKSESSLIKAMVKGLDCHGLTIEELTEEEIEVLFEGGGYDVYRKRKDAYKAWLDIVDPPEQAMERQRKQMEEDDAYFKAHKDEFEGCTHSIWEEIGEKDVFHE